MSIKSSLNRFHIPNYEKNAVLQLIAYLGVGFIGIRLFWVTLIVFAVPMVDATGYSFENFGLRHLQAMPSKWWTVFTYNWFHHGFWEWLSNMLWLYCFGNALQNLIGYRQIIPLYIYASFAGAIFFIIYQVLVPNSIPYDAVVMGAHVGIFAFVIATLTLSPNYKIYFSDFFGLPLYVLGSVYLLLIMLHGNFNPIILMMLLGAAIMSFLYIKLIQNGMKPGVWIYEWIDGMNQKFSPTEAPKVIKSSKDKSPDDILIDQILDKINESGFESLSQKDKDFLRNAKR
jgi:membrane associated rhomboid family serine protease